LQQSVKHYFEPVCAAGTHRKRFIATANRREGVYNRTGAPSVTFCGKGAAAERMKNTQSEDWVF